VLLGVRGGYVVVPGSGNSVGYSEARQNFSRWSFAMKIYLFAPLLAILPVTPGYANAADAALTDDISRHELFQYAVSLEFGPAVTIPERFALPDDTRGKPEWTFGVDISHYDGRVNWELVSSQGVAFVYVKATQGEAGYDGKFAENWSALAKLNSQPRLWRGAYHFLSADADARAQAQNFLKVAGAAAAGDMPPCLDLEWDIVRGGSQDRFSKYTAEQIVEKAKMWLVTVEQASPGRKPIIYTNKTFWLQHGLDKTSGLEGYGIWIADYTQKSRLAQTPIAPAGFEIALWQFSEMGHFTQSGIAATHVDVSLFKGGRPDFAKRFALPE